MPPLFARHLVYIGAFCTSQSGKTGNGDHSISKANTKGSFYVQQIRRHMGFVSARNA